MTKKDFEAIAAIIRRLSTIHVPDENGQGMLLTVTNDLAEYFATVNPNFDRAKFLKACGF